ncbi:sensor histidine kinase [Caballeronia sp. BR00000012568055]|uniref:sensor histidine kinase n=1 Tax=Caballeronia sp. BR00000012568055 TaxID=2918761 RepID=UPI0023F7F064|nr:ATP-binding protein [Caballeronia sp. BR00000012568055]
MKPSARVSASRASLAASSAASASSSACEGEGKLEGDRRIERLTARVRDLAAQIVSVEEHTRRALAQDLHDDAGAAMTAANIALARVAHWLPADAPDACADALRQARACLADITEACHRIVEDLHEPAFDLGVGVAIEQWIAGFSEQTAIPVNFNQSVEIPLDRLPRDIAIALYRVMQEALSNAARHAQATRVSVSIALDAQSVTLIVEDDGVGITPVARRKTGRFGLSGMRSRCDAPGGSLRIVAAKAGGTSVRARLPLNGAARRMLRVLNA